MMMMMTLMMMIMGGLSLLSCNVVCFVAGSLMVKLLVITLVEVRIGHMRVSDRLIPSFFSF